MLRADAYWQASQIAQPAVLWLHGGALIVGSRRRLPLEQAEHYVEAGFTRVAATYRLAPQVRLPAILQDVQDAYGWMRSRGAHALPIDPGRICSVGHSPDAHYGQQPRVSADMADAAIAWPTIAASEPEPRLRFYVYCRQHGLWPQVLTGYNPAVAPAAVGAWCPAGQVSASFPPTLLVHGEQDTDVPVQQSYQMAEALAAGGVEHELLTVPGRGHGFDLESQGLQDRATANAFARATAFLRRHVAPT